MNISVYPLDNWKAQIENKEQIEECISVPDQVCKNGSRHTLWYETDSLYDALEPILKKAHHINVVGAGGKTTLIDKLAVSLQQKNQTSVITTTTHRYAPTEFDCTGQKIAMLNQMLSKEGIAVIGTPCGDSLKEQRKQISVPGNDQLRKIMMPKTEDYEQAKKLADYMLVEADGSKRRPIKYPNQTEPVLTKECDACLIVAGLSALGKSLNACCHRYELVCSAAESGMTDRTIVSESVIVWLITHGYIKPLTATVPNIPYIIILNQADDETKRQAGKNIIETLCTSEHSIELGLVTSLVK